MFKSPAHKDFNEKKQTICDIPFVKYRIKTIILSRTDTEVEQVSLKPWLRILLKCNFSHQGWIQTLFRSRLGWPHHSLYCCQVENISAKSKVGSSLGFQRKKTISGIPFIKYPSADLEVQLVQLNHCDGVYSNYWNTLLRNLKLCHTSIFMSRSALGHFELRILKFQDSKLQSQQSPK